VNFEWPKADDILQMPRDKPFDVTEIRWKEDAPANPAFKAVCRIGVTLANGVHSPLLGSDNLRAREDLSKSVNLPAGVQVKYVKGQPSHIANSR